MKPHHTRMQLKIKRALDIFAGCILLVVLLPIWVIVAIIVKATSRGPVFYIQARPGLDGVLFRVYKFRTMELGSDTMVKGVEVMVNDPRVTSIGRLLRRTKLDELPQLYNVIRGEMSLVGPRPERIESLDDYTDRIRRRLSIRPGLTGLAQVSGNIHLPLQSRYELDLIYVDNFSLLLDAKILIRTVGVLVYGEEKYVNRPIRPLF